MSTSKLIISVLQDHGFRKRENVADRYHKMTNAQRERFLDEIAQVYVSNKAGILQGCQAPADSFSIYPEHDSPLSTSVESIKQFALYADQVVIPDPLVAHHPQLQSGLTISAPDGKEEREERKVVEAIELLVSLKDLIREGWVKIFPKELYVEATGKMYSRVLGNNFSNAELTEYARARMRVEPAMMNADGSFTVFGGSIDKPTRCIAVNFADDSEKPLGMLWFFTQARLGENLIIEESERTIGTYVSPDALQEPLDENKFQAWLADCRERTVMGKVQRGYEHIAFAEGFNSHFVAHSPALWELLRIQYENKLLRADQTQISSVVSELDLSFLSNVSGSDIAKLRKNEEAFENFRRAIRDFARSITALPGTSEFSKQVKEIRADKIDAELKKMDEVANRTKQKFFVDAFITTGSLSLAAATGQFLWLSTLLTAMPNFVSASRDQEQLSKNALFFLWKLRR